MSGKNEKEEERREEAERHDWVFPLLSHVHHIGLLRPKKEKEGGVTSRLDERKDDDDDDNA